MGSMGSAHAMSCWMAGLRASLELDHSIPPPLRKLIDKGRPRQSQGLGGRRQDLPRTATRRAARLSKLNCDGFHSFTSEPSMLRHAPTGSSGMLTASPWSGTGD